jgi:NAD(P)-dependent dehydrogenase (short-subunit alcohol dehydrogenase family)
MTFDLHAKTAIVTGGGSGIGRAIAERFAAHGAAIEILDLDNEHGQSGAAAHAQTCDVAQSADVDRCVADIVQRRGRVDILVNNAGVPSIGSLSQTDEAELDRVYAVNVKGVFNGLKACVDRMVAAGGGVILNLGSIASLVGIPDRFAYSMSKGAVLTMTLSVARDYVDMGIRCNCICPARVHTPFVDAYLEQHYPRDKAEMFDKLSNLQPIGRMGKPEEIAALALFLCSDEAAFITGAVYPIDGGFATLR